MKEYIHLTISCKFTDCLESPCKVGVCPILFFIHSTSGQRLVPGKGIQREISSIQPERCRESLSFWEEEKEVQQSPIASIPNGNSCVPTEVLVWVSLIFEKLSQATSTSFQGLGKDKFSPNM